MHLSSRMVRTLFALVGLLVLSNCATTQETMKECRQSAYDYCEKTVGSKAPAGTGTGTPSGRNVAFQQCLDTQVGACGLQ